LGQDLYRWTGWHRNLQREAQKAHQIIAKRRLENQKTPTWSAEDLYLSSVPQYQKVLQNEPSRLDQLLMQKRLETYANQIGQFAGPGIAKMFGVQGFQA
jgi:hypothetical protein